MKSFLRAINFLTVIPFDKYLSMEREEVAQSSSYFPLVGALMGLFLVLVNAVLGPVFSDQITNLFILVALVALSGGLHLDGFVDSADGLFSGKDKKGALEIMKDSRVGAFGILSLIFLVLFKFSLLNEIDFSIKAAVLILMPALSRWTIVFNGFFYPYARQGQGAGEPFANLVGKKELIEASIFTFFLSFFFLGAQGLLAWLIVFLFNLLLGKLIEKKIKGMTGDTYGALVEVAEVVFLIAVYFI
jgi:adenosylcobinamide-GDP ribazoletransferase